MHDQARSEQSRPRWRPRVGPSALEGIKIGGRQLPSSLIAIVGSGELWVGEQWLFGVVPPSSASPTVDLGSQHTHLDLLVKMVSSVPDESARIICTYFRAKTTNFVSGSEPNGALFWGNDFKFILVVKNAFQRCLICLCLKSFAKSHIFQDKLWIDS